MTNEDKSSQKIVANNKLLDSIHINIHGIRSVAGYKASPFEMNLNKLIAEHYKNKCDECLERTKKLVSEQKDKSSFVGKLLGADE